MARRRRRRRRNPVKNRSGLGAFLGSFVGSTVVMTPGILVGSPALVALGTLGSIGGGAIGGWYGAKGDRRRRGAIGGAVGGIAGPIGAAIGGYVGGLEPDARRSNPSGASVALAIGAGIAAVGAGYGAYKMAERRKFERKALPSDVDVLQGIVGNSTLEETSFMVGDIQQPILLQTPTDPLPVDDEFDRVAQLRVQIVRPAGETTIEEPAGAVFGVAGDSDQKIMLVRPNGDYEVHTMPKKAIAYLISGLSPEYARLAYELALVHIVDKGVVWVDATQRDAATAQILTTLAPKMDWTQGLGPYTYGSLPWKAWVGIQTIGMVANQSYFNKMALAGA